MSVSALLLVFVATAAGQSTCSQVLTSANVITGEHFHQNVVECSADVSIVSFYVNESSVLLVDNLGQSLLIDINAKEDFPEQYTVELSWTDSEFEDGNATIVFNFTRLGVTRPIFNDAEESRWWSVNAWDIDETVKYKFSLDNVERPDTTYIISDYIHVTSASFEKISFDQVITPLEDYMGAAGTTRMLTVTHDQIAAAVDLDSAEYVAFCVIVVDPFFSRLCDYTEDSEKFWRFADNVNKTNGCSCRNFIMEDINPTTPADTTLPPTDTTGDEYEVDRTAMWVMFGILLVSLVACFCYRAYGAKPQPGDYSALNQATTQPGPVGLM